MAAALCCDSGLLAGAGHAQGPRQPVGTAQSHGGQHRTMGDTSSTPVLLHPGLAENSSTVRLGVLPAQEMFIFPKFGLCVPMPVRLCVLSILLNRLFPFSFPPSDPSTEVRRVKHIPRSGHKFSRQTCCIEQFSSQVMPFWAT